MAELRAFHVIDAKSWNAFVAAADHRSFPQLWEWGELRRPYGWRPVRIAVGRTESSPVAGMQILIRRLPVLGWALGYAPRGPIGDLSDQSVRVALLAAIRSVGRAERVATLKVDPAVTATSPDGQWLLRRPWRAARRVQPPTTRVVDLRLSLEELHAGLKRKHRQSINRAVREGVTVEMLDRTATTAEAAQALADFQRMYELTARRAGFVARAPRYYRRVWELFSAADHARLYFARLDGERVATLFHILCGDRVATVYGGMTDRGRECRANYLLRWEAMQQFRAEGFATYDLWGLATDRVRQFKAGFGGVEETYVGARDLALRQPIDSVLRILVPAYRSAQHARLRLKGRRLATDD